MMLKMTAVVAAAYTRQFDWSDFGVHPLDRYRPVAAPIPPDMLEALRLTQLQVEMYERMQSNLHAEDRTVADMFDQNKIEKALELLHDTKKGW